jgi:S-methylmethionine-dependent homocysteine/selenocysteine methylase
MDVASQIRSNRFLLTEAAVIEALARMGDLKLHPRLMNALLVYDPVGRRRLEDLYLGFVDVAAAAGVPILLTTPTWRANRDWLTAAGETRDVNADAVRFMQAMRAGRKAMSDWIGIGGLLGCRNDCYRPEEGLSTPAAEIFHGWQAERLAAAGVDFLMAATLPAVPEATGMARALAETAVPYIISFVISRRGVILDGTTLEAAIQAIDAAVSCPPLGYMVNCAYPSFLNADSQPEAVLQRLVGYQANASSRDHWELDGSEGRQADDLEGWGRQMVALNREYGLKILGGCCGTGRAHLRYLTRYIVCRPSARP